MKYWTKSILSIYKYLGRLSNALDKIILDVGKGSNSVLLMRSQTTYYQANKIIELMDRKRKTINLKVAVEEVMSKLSKEDRRLLTLVFIDGVKSDLVAQLFGISLRTFFRKKITALENFSTRLDKMGFTEEFFEEEYSKEPWMAPVYDECASKNIEDDFTLDQSIINRVMNRMSKVNVAYNTYI